MSLEVDEEDYDLSLSAVSSVPPEPVEEDYDLSLSAFGSTEAQEESLPPSGVPVALPPERIVLKLLSNVYLKALKKSTLSLMKKKMRMRPIVRELY